MRILKTALVCAAAFASAAPAALAFERYVPYDSSIVVAHVSFDGLNLRTRRGANVALDKIADYSDRACGGRPRMGEVNYETAIHDYYACRDLKIRQGVEDTGSRMVARVYAERFGAVIVE